MLRKHGENTHTRINTHTRTHMEVEQLISDTFVPHTDIQTLQQDRWERALTVCLLCTHTHTHTQTQGDSLPQMSDLNEPNETM